jgi:hypothetical protein
MQMSQKTLPPKATYDQLKFKKDRIQLIRENVALDSKWALKALMRIYENQTSDEQTCLMTKYHNKIGFTGADAEILTSYAQQYNRRGWLTEPQMRVLHRKMPKYAKQLDDIAQHVQQTKAA